MWWFCILASSGFGRNTGKNKCYYFGGIFDNTIYGIINNKILKKESRLTRELIEKESGLTRAIIEKMGADTKELIEKINNKYNVNIRKNGEEDRTMDAGNIRKKLGVLGVGVCLFVLSGMFVPKIVEAKVTFKNISGNKLVYEGGYRTTSGGEFDYNIKIRTIMAKTLHQGLCPDIG